MVRLQQFEIDALRRLTEGVLAPDVLESVIRDADHIAYDYTGYGYFLTISHPQLPVERIVCQTPVLVGDCEGLQPSFVVFLEANEMTLECFPLDARPIPDDFRSREVAIHAI
jgi:hypothetical protein